MSYMFASADAFDQNLTGWDVSNVTGFTAFLSLNSLSPSNYDSLLIAWEKLDLRNDLTFGAGESQFTKVGEVARQSIIENYGWTISDGGLAPVETVTKDVSGDGFVDFGKTGVDIDFVTVTGSGQVTVERYDDAPEPTDGISEDNVSSYRLVITKSGSLDFGPSTQIQFPVPEFGGITDPETVKVYRRSTPNSGSFSALLTAVIEGGTPGDISDDILFVNTDAFSEFALASDTNPLPAELTSFQGQIKDGNIRLVWRTASESRNAGFEVERRRRDGAWQQLGFVEGNGTTANPQTYSFHDSNLPYDASCVVYRLRQVDTDGAYEYSPEVEILVGAPAKYALHTPFPNPTRGVATLRYELPVESDVRVEVFNVVGQQVITLVDERKSAGRYAVNVDAKQLTSGTYFIRMRSAGRGWTRKISVVQ